MKRADLFADASTLRLALIARTVEEPLVEWDPDSGAWIVRAHHRIGGGEWVLGQADSPIAFADQRAAKAAANWLRVSATPYLIGRR